MCLFCFLLVDLLKFAHKPVCCLHRTVYRNFVTSGCPNFIVHTDPHVYCFQWLDANHEAEAFKQPLETSQMPLSTICHHNE